ncbi:hypothetical protein ACIPPQ_14760 [Sphingopyxis sp. LARHCG72]
MLSRLDAEERLANIDVQALAFGALKEEDADRILTQLQCARDGIVPEPLKPTIATPEALAAIGIGVTIVDEGAAHD